VLIVWGVVPMAAPDVTTPREEDPGRTANTGRHEEADRTSDISGGRAGDAALADLIDRLDARTVGGDGCG
jgi:hypothetical protein